MGRNTRTFIMGNAEHCVEAKRLWLAKCEMPIGKEQTTMKIKKKLQQQLESKDSFIESYVRMM